MTTSSLDVVVVGAVGVDTNVFPCEDTVDFSVEGHFSENLDCPGQAGVYTSRGYAALGYRAGVIGYVGRDPLGDWVRRTLVEDGIEPLLFVDPAGTHRSVNLMSLDGRRRNFYDAKGAMTLEPDLSACRAMLARTGLVHLHIQNWCRRLIAPARELGLVVACDLQDVTHPDDPYRDDFVKGADILFFSATNHPDPTALCARYLAFPNVKVVVVGQGARGAVLATRTQGMRFFPPVQDPRPVVDTNGAGDALAVGFLSSFVLQGLSPEASLHRGQVAARHACTLKGTSGGLAERL